MLFPLPHAAIHQSPVHYDIADEGRIDKEEITKRVIELFTAVKNNLDHVWSRHS